MYYKDYRDICVHGPAICRDVTKTSCEEALGYDFESSNPAQLSAAIHRTEARLSSVLHNAVCSGL